MFNALKYTEILETVGFTREQAEQSIKVLIEVMEQNLASSQDLKDLKQELIGEISKLDQKVTTEASKLDQKITNISYEMKNLEARMTIKLGSLMVLAIGIVTALNKI